MKLETMKERLCKKFGDDVKTEVVTGILVVHVDDPDPTEIKRRYAEVRNGNFEMEDDCPLCQEMKQTPPEVVIFDRDSVLYLGNGSTGMIASGMPRRNKKDVSSGYGKTS